MAPLQRSERRQVARIVGVGLILVFLAWAVFNFATVRHVTGIFIGFFRPFIVGLVVAFIINLPMGFIEGLLFRRPWARGEKFRGTVKRALAILLSFLTIIGILVGLGFLVVPEIIQMFRALSERVPEAMEQLQEWLHQKEQEGGTLRPLFERVDQWVTESSRNALSGLQNRVVEIAQTAIQYVSSIASAIVTFVIGLIFSVYILAKKETLGRQLKKMVYAFVPERMADSLFSIGALASSIFGRFVAGQALEAVILGLMFFFAMLILRLPYAAMIGALTMVTALIPIYGAIITAVLGGFLILVESPVQALIFLIMAIALQQLEGDIIYPHVVGNAVGLPSIWTFVAVTLGGNVAGILGMMIAVPVASLIYLLLAAYARKRLDTRDVNPLKFGFVLFDPTMDSGETELARRQRLARIAVGGETMEERARRERESERLHKDHSSMSWREQLESRYQAFVAARKKHSDDADDT